MLWNIFWMVAHYRTDLQINLLHPISKHLLCLPPQPTFSWQYDSDLEPKDICEMFLQRVVLSKSPWNPATQECDCDCVIMVIYGEYQQLAFTRPGYKSWTDIKSSRRRRYADIAFYKGKFYALDYDGALVVCRIDDNKMPRAKAIAPPLEGITMSFKWNVQKYIVESSGGLLLVTRYRGDDDLRVFNCTRNDGGSDMGVFSMEDAEIKSHYSGQSLSFFCAPLWYI
ncbi:putative f-box protein [Quercus suber]|uniref:F-box protein n=1 Tax=Quercus suber TaxID=58331 RepID=A0AAW0K9Z1_QUESU